MQKFKLASLVVLVSGLCTSCVVSDYFSDASGKNIDVNAAKQEVEQQKREEAERIAREKQQQAETKVTEMLGGRELQFKSAVAKIYLDNEFTALWTDQTAEKKFLREYALMVSSGISSRSAKSLNEIDSATNGDPLVRDILLTDAFLDYLYYSQNVANAAQSWLYSSNSYKSAKPTDQQVEQWLSAVKNNQFSDFVTSISPSNKLYKQTTDYLISNLNGGAKNSSGVLSKLAINAQRLRIIPNFSNGIYVNIPSYQLNYYRDGNLVLNSRVIVGKTERKTPVMDSKLSNVVVNPPWNAPTRLINEDIIPKVKRDPSYLSRNGYVIIDGKGNTINPYSINWGSIGTKFPYRLRQQAGDNSALGRFKFNMPSSDAIYLHDTPNHALFNQKARALSSGCVRVEKSDELATILLKEAGWSAEKKQRVLDSKKTTSAQITSNNPVYLYYVTTWVENGKVQKLPDIYSYDSANTANFVNWNIIRKYL